MKRDNSYTMISSLRAAGYLMFAGCPLLYTSPDKNNTSRLVFWFDNTPELEDALHQYGDLKVRYGSTERICDNINRYLL